MPAIREGQWIFGGDPEFRYVKVNLATGRVSTLSASGISPGGPIGTNGMSDIGELRLDAGRYGARNPYFPTCKEALDYFANVEPSSPDNQEGGIFRATTFAASHPTRPFGGSVDLTVELPGVCAYSRQGGGAGSGGHIHCSSHPKWMFRPISYAIIPFWLGLTVFCYEKGRWDQVRQVSSYGQWGDTHFSPDRHRGQENIPEAKLRVNSNQGRWSADKSCGYEYRTCGTYMTPGNQIYRDIISRLFDTCIAIPKGRYNLDASGPISGRYTWSPKEKKAFEFIVIATQKFFANAGSNWERAMVSNSFKEGFGNAQLMGNRVFRELHSKMVSQENIPAMAGALAETRNMHQFNNYTEFDWLLLGQIEDGDAGFKEPRPNGRRARILKMEGGQFVRNIGGSPFDLNPKKVYVEPGREFKFKQPPHGMRPLSTSTVPAGWIKTKLLQAAEIARRDWIEVLEGEFMCWTYGVDVPSTTGLELAHIIPQGMIIAKLVSDSFDLEMPQQPEVHFIAIHDRERPMNVPFHAPVGFVQTLPLNLIRDMESAFEIELETPEAQRLQLRLWFRENHPVECATIVAAYILWRKGLLRGEMR